MEFHEAVKDECVKLMSEGKRVIVTGDINIAHQEIDIFNPVKFSGQSGFLKTERDWVTRFLSSGFTDAFRKLYPQERSYSFWDTRTNCLPQDKGWRIDAFYVSNNFQDKIRDSKILKSAISSSDHCPITLEIDVEVPEPFSKPVIDAGLWTPVSSSATLKASISSTSTISASNGSATKATLKRKPEESDATNKKSKNEGKVEEE
ncbi:hypothetical protein HDU76_014064 [Blyttiomyces sp. JEL0837]|nr:hypothetical protein HDU76_014064 [Blyttiomyces sp. JEL0837]